MIVMIIVVCLFFCFRQQECVKIWHCFWIIFWLVVTVDYSQYFDNICSCIYLAPKCSKTAVGLVFW